MDGLLISLSTASIYIMTRFMKLLTKKSCMGFSTFTREKPIFAAEENTFYHNQTQELPTNRRVKRSVECVHYTSILERIFVLGGKAAEWKSY